MRILKVDHDEINKAVRDGDTYLQIGNRKFMLFEVEEVSQSGFYEVTDSEEESLLLEAMNGDNPSLPKQEVLEQLSRHKQQ